MIRLKPGAEERVRVLLEHFFRTTFINEEGLVSSQYADFGESMALLHDGFDTDSQLDRAEFLKSVHDALISNRISGDKGISSLCDKINSFANKMIVDPNKKYRLWSKIRLRNYPEVGDIGFSLNGVYIKTTKTLPAYMHLDEYTLSGFGRVDPHYAKHHLFVIASCSARGESQAADRIFAALYLWLAVCNAHWRRGRSYRSPVHTPEAALWLGPYQFMYHDRKPLTSQYVWHSASFRDEDWNRFEAKPEEFELINGHAREFLKILRRHPLKDALVGALRLIDDGMTSFDLSYRLLKYWTALERIYSKEKESAPSKTIIRRALFAINDTSIVEWKLQLISSIRSQYVHSYSHDEDDIDDWCQFIRIFVLRHIFYLLQNGDDFESHDRFIAMTDLKADSLDQLAVDLRRRQRALQSGRHRDD